MSVKFRCISIIFLFCWTNYSIAQTKMEWSFDMIYGEYNLNDFRRVNREYQQNLDKIDFKKINEFPKTPIWGVSSIVWHSGFGIGASIGFSETGSRYSYSDYSGLIRSDILAKFVNFSLLMVYETEPVQNLSLIFELMPGWSISNVIFEDLLSIGSYEETNKLRFTSNNQFITASIGLKYHWKFFIVKTSIGYQTDVHQGMLNQGNNKYDLKANWSGFRTGISIGIRYENR